ncbi:hypothetical protein GA0115245_11816 [Streptomyces sp. di188]|nr:hypothetical protein GA0115238_12656 [Streptomyces sp. di50b]SCD97949.1 hypothetical protein GA0115245_11816 [Streptomyces sp. di188]
MYRKSPVHGPRGDHRADQAGVFEHGVGGDHAAHGESHEDGGSGVEVAQQRGQVVGPAERRGGVGGEPVATRVGGDDPVPLSEEGHVVVPDPVVEEAGVQQDDEVTGARVAVGEVAVGGREEAEIRGISHDNQGVMLDLL